MIENIVFVTTQLINDKKVSHNVAIGHRSREVINQRIHKTNIYQLDSDNRIQ